MHSPEDFDLRSAFEELRAEEQRQAPRFDLSGAPAPRRRFQQLAFASILLVITAGAVIYMRRPAPRALPQVSISTWKAPTDFLLQTPEAKLLRTVPTFGLPKKGTRS